MKEFMEKHDSYSDPVVEVMDAVVQHQIRTISENFLKIMESLRLLMCHALCTEACAYGGGGDGANGFGGTFGIDEHMQELQSNLDMLSPSANWRQQVRVFMYEVWLWGDVCDICD